MRPPTPPGATPPGATLLSRAALALYPPSWRARYADEIQALLDDSGGGLAAVAATVMAVASAAIVAAVISLCLWAHQFAGYHHVTGPGIYLVLVVAAATVTTVSAARGTRAALAEP